MSPEQAAGDSVDHRGDIYSLGVILYELAAGKVPFDAENFMGILTQHIYKTPMPLRSLEPKEEEVPPGLEAVILKCLSKKPENRYASMEDLCADLASLAEGFEPSAVPDLSSRTDDFNVPVEYFRIGVNAGKIRAAAPLRGARRWPLYAGIATVLGALLAVLTVTVLSALSTAAPPEANDLVATPSSGAEVANSRQPAPGRDPDPAEEADSGVVQVALAVVPLDARVFQGNQDLGKSPVLVEVAKGTTVKVTLRRSGYQSRTIELDGSEERRSVKLKRAVSKRSSKRPQGSNKLIKPSIGGGDIVNPWD
jgi:serine/threonine-protein kinase